MVRRWCGIQQPAHPCHRVSVLGCYNLQNSYFEAASHSPFSVSLTAFTRICYCEVTTSHSGGFNETAGSANDLTRDPGSSRFYCENVVRVIVPRKSSNRKLCLQMGWDGLPRIDVDKSASHQLSQSEIASDNPCDQHLSLCYKATGIPMNKQPFFLAFLVCLLLASAAVLLTGDLAARPAGDDLWPTKGWATASPASVGLDEQVLVRLDKDMASGKYSQMIDSFAVFRCGKKVFERTYPHDYAKIYGKEARERGP